MDAPVHCHFRASGEEFRLMVARVVGLGPTASSMPFEEKTRFRKRLIAHLQRLMPPLMLSALVSGALPLIGRDRGLPAPKTAAPILSGVILVLTLDIHHRINNRILSRELERLPPTARRDISVWNTADLVRMILAVGALLVSELGGG